MDYYFVKRFRGNVKMYVSGATAGGSYTWTSDRKQAIKMSLEMAAKVEMDCNGLNYCATHELVDENELCANMGERF